MPEEDAPGSGRKTASVEPDRWGWLKENSPETLAWQAARDEEARAALRGWPGWSELCDRVTARISSGRVVAPIPAGGHWFHWSGNPGEGSRLEMSDSVDGPRQAVWATETAAQIVSAIYPAPTARHLGIGLTENGDEWNGRLIVVDSETGLVIDQVPFSPFASTLAWLPDGSGFFYCRPAQGQAGLELWFHPIDGQTREHSEAVDIPEGVAAGPLVSTDGRFVALGLDGRPRFILDRDHSDAGWRSFMTGATGEWRGVIVGHDFLAITNVGAPRGRLVRVPLATDSDVSTYETIVPESDAVLRAVTVAAGPTLILSEFVDAACRLRAITTTGADVGSLVLDEPVTLMTDGRAAPWFGIPMATSSPDCEEVGVASSSFTASAAVSVWRPAEPKPRFLSEPAIHLADVTVERCRAVSADGTHVPYYLLSSPGGSTDPRPCVLTGYGGYNTPQLPRYQAWMAVLLDLGIRVAVAIQRGGGEFGSNWCDQGRFECRQNSFDDLYAVAEDLVRIGVTGPDQLGLYGASNGGLLALMAAVQRPELFAVVAAVAPLTDLVAAGSDPLTAYLVRQDFGDSARAEDLPQLLAASPYHNVVPGQPCPPTIVACPSEDVRCPPWHGRKIVAALRDSVEGGDHHILLRIWEGAGHLGGGVVSPAERLAEWLGFLVSHVVEDRVDPKRQFDGRTDR